MKKYLDELLDLATKATKVNTQINHTKAMFEAYVKTGDKFKADEQRALLHALLDESLDITSRCHIIGAEMAKL